GFDVGTTTAWRYVRETTALLAKQAPTLEWGLRRARRKGWGYVIVDGTLIACDRVAADRPFYSGKHKRHGMNIQVVAARTSCTGPRSAPEVHSRASARCAGGPDLEDR